MKFVDITNDVAFRKIFGNATKKKVLISFLNAVINLPDNGKITDVEITTPYQLGKLSDSKSTIVDVKAKDANGNVFIVEMQVAEHEFFLRRILYYTSQSIVTQIDRGGDYHKLRPVYFIGILEFKVGNNPNYFSRHLVLDVETKENLITNVEFNFIELPKFNKTFEELQPGIDQWAYFLKNVEYLTTIPETITDEGLKEAYIEAAEYSWSKQELDDYLRASIREGDEINRVGFAVNNERKRVAKGFRDSGVPIDIIVKNTGLTKKEIENL